MFCEYNKIKKILNCKNCNKKLTDPKQMPCGETICSDCQSTIQVQDDNYFTCIACSNKHIMPVHGLPVNKIILSLLLIQPEEVSRGGSSKLLIESLTKIKSNIDELKFGIENGHKMIQDYCFKLRTEIETATDLANKQITESKKIFLKKIDAYEQECFQRYEEHIKEKEAINKAINEMKIFQTKWTDYLNELQINDQIVIDTNEKAIEIIKNAQNEICKLNNILFNNRIEFRKSSEDDSNLIASLGHMIHIKIDSNILTSDLFDLLMDICPFKLNQKWKLLYRATQNGFGSADFHKRCDGKLNTLVVIKSENNNIFGGYTEQDWSGNSEFKKDPNVFIFSLVNSFKISGLFKCLDEHSIFCFQEYGPTFGFTGSICIRNHSNMVNSSSKSSTSYKVPSNTYLAGAENFLTIEIEVYLKE